MAELDKIIKQLEVLIEDTKYSDVVDLTPDEAKTILELLKEQQKAIEDAYYDGYSVGYDAKKAEIEEEYGVL